MVAVFFAFIAFFGWAFGDLMGAVGSRKIGGYSTLVWFYLIELVFCAFYAPFVLNELAQITPSTILILLFLSIIGPISGITFFEGLRLGSASLVSAISASFTGLVVILSIIFLGDRLNLWQTIFIIIVFGGVFLSSFHLNDLKNKRLFTNIGVPYALITLVLWGIYFTFIKIPVREIGWFWPSFLGDFSFIIVLAYMRFKKIAFKMPKPKILGIIAIGAILSQIAGFAYSFAISKGQTAIIAPIAGSYPAFGVFLMYWVFKDKINKQQIAGIIVTLIGIVLLSFFSG